VHISSCQGGKEFTHDSKERGWRQGKGQGGHLSHQPSEENHARETLQKERSKGAFSVSHIIEEKCLWKSPWQQ